MNTKSKIWQIVLLALLVLAIAAILLFNNKLNASKESLSNTIAQLAEAQENSAALQSDLDTAKADYEAVSAQLTEAQANAETLQGDLDAANDKVSELETAAADAETKIGELETAAAEAEEKITALETATTEKDETIATLETAVQEKDAAIEALTAAAEADEEPAADDLTAAMTRVEDALLKVAGVQALDEVPEAAAGVDLDAVREEIAAIVEDPEKTAEAQVEALAAIEQTLAEALPDDIADITDAQAAEAVQAQLDAAEAQVQQLTEELAEQMTTIDALNEQIADLGAQAETDASQLSALKDQLAEAETEAQAKSEALAAAEAEYAKNLAALEAYRVQRDLASGEAHIATAVDNAIEVAEDGVTAAWQYKNSDLSGNAATLSLVMDGETIYTSPALKPGETIESLTLDKPLEPGAHEALAITTVYDEAGEPQLTSRVPVTLNVAG